MNHVLTVLKNRRRKARMIALKAQEEKAAAIEAKKAAKAAAIDEAKEAKLAARTAAKAKKAS